MQVIERSSAKPKMYKALLGYRHYVSNKQQANQYEAVSLMGEERLNNFGMESLSSSIKARIRKGLRLTEIRKIENIETVIDGIKEIEISKAIRIGHENPEYYVRNYESWKAWIIKQFYEDKGRKEYWGSFYNDTLIAIMKFYQIDDTVIINYSSSHTDYMDKCPNDALMFSILDYCKQLKDCKKVSYGLWSTDRESLNRFKLKFGFERVDLPVYAKYNFHIIPVAKKILEIKQLRKVNELIRSYLIQLKK
jgi:hypothetical protein